jgi:phosphoribosylformimino-5-aminoimidazole carboxamide ribotide isomerase
VGGSLSDSGESLRTNFVSEKSSAWFANLYRQDKLAGGHIIMLGPGNEAAAREALGAWPGGMQIGGGIHSGNAAEYLAAGASQVIVTSYIFKDGRVEWKKLEELSKQIGPEKLVIDLSCRRRGGDYFVVTDRWQKFTDLILSRETLDRFAPYCAEFLVHAVDVEGLCRGIDSELAGKLADWSSLPATYAGGAKSLEDLQLVEELGRGKIDLTIGSALDIFGGSGVRYSDAVAFNASRARR